MNYKHPNILVVDNYDSFTYNLVQIIREHGGCSFDVILNNIVSVDSVSIYDGFLFSPGPGVPADVPVMAELLREYCHTKSFLGICLGHQAIGAVFGMQLFRLGTVCHGMKTRVKITDSSDYLFNGMPSEFDAGLYHSWAVSSEEENPVSPAQIRVTATSQDGIIMAMTHVKYDIKGIQFHPESYISEYGQRIIHNWIDHLASAKT